MTYYDELIKYGVPDSIPNDGFAFEDLFDEYIASTQKTWQHDRSQSVGASEAFGCIRKSWFSKRGKYFGFEKDEDYKESWGAMRRGDILENYHVVPAVKAGLRRRGMELILEGEDQSTIVDGKSSATLDGLIIGAPYDLLEFYGIDDIESDCVVLEMKSFDPRIDIREEKAIHRGQVQMQMGHIRNTTAYKPNYAVILYVNASWLDDIRVFIVEYDESVYKIGLSRANKVFDIDDPSLLAAEGKFDGGCSYCPFKNTCDKVSVARVPTTRTKALTKKEVAAQDTELLEELDELVRIADNLRSKKKDVERDLEEANEAVRQALIAANENRVVGEDWKVSYTTVAGRRTLSADKLRDAGLDPEDYMSEGSAYEKLTITLSHSKD